METADVVIVGAGSAGCVLAARLTEDGRRRVVLLEAGGDNDTAQVRQPSLWPDLWDSDQNWGYSTTAQAGLGGRSIACPRGKGLGGTSAINALVYMRGDPLDFDYWRDLGNPGWGWSDVLPWFLKSEDQARGAGPLHGVGGPLRVSDPAQPAPASQAFIDAALACGHRPNADFNGERRDGAGLYQLTIDGADRACTARAFLAPARGRAGLQVHPRSRALRVLMEGSRAVGVEYLQAGAVRQVMAGEVVLSAGAIDSPRLLMLSGIGDPAQLQPLGIAVRQALPGVGANLHDHPGSALMLRLRDPARMPASSNFFEAGMFMRSQRLDDGQPTHLQFLFTPYGPPAAASRGKAWAAMLFVQACQPRSRGRLRLRSADPTDMPLIDPAYLTDPQDLALQVEGMHEARRIAAAGPLRAFVDAEVLPGPAARSDAELGAALRATSACIYHPVGTCRMGPCADAVVDASLRVHGVQGLRVVDASVMPRITSGNTNAPTIMIAEKAAAMDWSAAG